jgi:hypothetical protein
MDLIPNLSLNAIAYPSILPFLLGPRHHAIPQNQRNSPLAERKQIADRGLFCRILLKKPSFFRMDSSPCWTHRSGPLPNFGVNRSTTQKAKDIGNLESTRRTVREEDASCPRGGHGPSEIATRTSSTAPGKTDHS